MNLNQCIDRLRANQAAIQALLRGVPVDQMRWKPSPVDWSLLEVACHLYDEEREDFRQRLDLTLHAPEALWSPIRPAEWVVERAYNAREPMEVLDGLQREREASLAWLAALDGPNWQISRVAPWGGTMRAGDVLVSWVAHDHLHLRQLNELHFLHHRQAASPFAVAYAGDW